jgi:hypothetical protein
MLCISLGFSQRGNLKTAYERRSQKSAEHGVEALSTGSLLRNRLEGRSWIRAQTTPQHWIRSRSL